MLLECLLGRYPYDADCGPAQLIIHVRAGQHCLASAGWPLPLAGCRCARGRPASSAAPLLTRTHAAAACRRSRTASRRCRRPAP